MTDPTAGRDSTTIARVWHLAEPARVIASASVGGGIGLRNWIINAQVPRDYDRTDLEHHVTEIARVNGCTGIGVGMLTAASIERARELTEGDVVAYASVGVTKPTWAADADGAISPWKAGTINIVAFLPEPLTDDALVNAVMTVTEAKSQAMVEGGVPGTGTASDAVCVVCPAGGAPQRFAGPRSPLGAPLARAVFAAVAAGIVHT